eukprot:scaffold3038_cov163-Amphora_coffeaeformis.AAC.5
MGHLVYWIAISAVVVGLLASLPHPELEWNERVLPMAQSFAQVETDTPLTGKVVVITGATSGIGLSLTRMLSRLGATVVALGRSPSKLAQLQDEISTVQTVQVDLVDLQSVANAAQIVSAMHERIDILVNNAGIHDGFDNLFGEYETKQGYDQVFGVNYLSHYLLTEKLAPNVMNSTNPVVLQVSSLYHWASDGSDLRPAGDSPPLASQKGGSHGFLVFRSTRSYANSKLAQILHSRALKRHHPLLSKARIVNVCPAWVLTQIQRAGGIFKHVLVAGAYDVNGWGMASTLLAIFDNNNEKSADFYSNTRVSDIASYAMAFQTNWMYKLSIRDAIGNFMAFAILLSQRLLPDARATVTSPPSYDETLGDALYEWSMSAVGPFL